MNSRQKGLTLIELMVVVAVLAIVSAIAYPLYEDYVQTARRADAKVALQKIALAQERFYTVNGAYTDDVTKLSSGGKVLTLKSDDGYYDLSTPHNPLLNDQTFEAKAEAKSKPQSEDTGCTIFTINQVGEKTGCW